MTPPARTDAGVVFALPIEAGRFGDRVGEMATFRTNDLTLHEGVIARRTVAWVVAGTGVERAARATRLLIDGHRPRLVIAAGFAGGLVPGIDRGSLVTPGRVVRPGLEPLPLLSLRPGVEGQTATIVTVDRVVCATDEKRRLADDTRADVVDLETWGIAAAARDAGLPCGCCKIVSDSVLDELPAEVARLTEAPSRWRRVGAALRTIGRRPAAAADLWKLWERAVIDSRSLADALERAISALPAAVDAGP